jgi:hypothetical protein
MSDTAIMHSLVNAPFLHSGPSWDVKKFPVLMRVKPESLRTMADEQIRQRISVLAQVQNLRGGEGGFLGKPILIPGARLCNPHTAD